jgi:PAS domain S-box-containing protein
MAKHRPISPHSIISPNEGWHQLPQSLLDFLPMPIFFKDANLVYCGCNSAFEKCLGISREELCGKNVFDLAPPKLATIYNHHDHILLDCSTPQTYEESVRFADGQLHHVWFQKALYTNSTGTILGIVGLMIDMTSRHQAEKALQKSEECLALALHGARLGLWDWDVPSGQISNNERAAELMGYQTEATPNTLEWWMEKIHPEDRTLAQAQIDAHLAGQTQLLEIEMRYQTHHAGWRWFRLCGSTVARDSQQRPRRLTGTFQDIDRRKQAELSLLEKQNTLESIFQNSLVGIGLMVNRRIVQVNNRLAQILGYTPEEMVNQSPRFIHLSQKNHDAFGKQYYWRLAQQDFIQIEYPLRHKDGHTVWCQFNGKAIAPPDLSKGAIWIIDDITQRKEAEEQQRQLKLRTEQLRKLKSLGVMADGIAHHFNNKLAAVQGNLELSLLDETLSPSTRQCLSDALKATRNAAKVSTLMLTYTGNCQPRPTHVDFTFLLQNMRSKIRSQFPKHLAFCWLLPQHPLIVQAVPKQLEKVIMNLVHNAAEAIGEHEGAITIRLDRKACDRSCANDSNFREKYCGGHCLKLEISDSGCGMSPEQVDKIFDPFFTTKFPGRGLGLAEVFGIVRTHHGSITINTRPDAGTSVLLSLPEAPPEK